MGIWRSSCRTARRAWATIGAVILAAGMTLVAPASAATFTVSGTITVPAGLSGLWLDVRLMQDEFTSVGISPSLTVAGTSVPYSVSGVAPGTYYLAVSGSFLNGRNGIYPTTSEPFTVSGNVTVNLTAVPAYLVRPHLAGGVRADLQFYRSCSDYDPIHPRPVVPLFVPGEEGFELPPGAFRVLLSPRDHDFLESWHRAKPTCDSADPVVITGDGDIFLQPMTGGGIEGTVTHHGRPLAGVHVSALMSHPEGASAGDAVTDASGQYRIGPLEAGTYRVVFTGGEENPLGLYSVFWPDVTHRDQASAIDVGDTMVSGIDARLWRAASLSGTVQGPRGPVAGAKIAVVELYRCGDDSPCGYFHYTRTDADGAWTVKGIAPGRYILHVKAGYPLGQEAWNNKAGLEEADPIALAPEEVCTGFDVYRKVAEPRRIQPTCNGGVARRQTLTRPPMTMQVGLKARLAKRTDAGQRIRWQSRTKSVCSVTAAHVKALKKGRCRIRATAAATPGWKAYAKTFRVRVVRR